MPADVIVLTNDMSVRGGTQAVVARITLGLRQTRTVRLVALEGAEPAYPELRSVPFTTLGAGNAGSTAGVVRIPFQAKSLASLVATERPRAVLSFLARANLVNILARRLSRHAFTCAISERNFNSIQYAEGLSRRMLRQAMRWLYPRADVVIANSAALAKDLHTSFHVPQPKLEVVPNPIDIKRIDALAAETVPDPRVAGLSPPWLLFVGRLNEQKNPVLLLRAFRAARNRVSCKLVIAGDGPLRPEVERAIGSLQLSDDVILLGWAQNPYALMKRATALVLPSNYEGSANVVLEAMAVGCPVIATDSPGGSREALLDGKAGVLVPPGDEAALVAAIAEVVADDRLRARLTEAGRTAAIGYSAERVLEALSAALDR